LPFPLAGRRWDSAAAPVVSAVGAMGYAVAFEASAIAMASSASPGSEALTLVWDI